MIMLVAYLPGFKIQKARDWHFKKQVKSERRHFSEKKNQVRVSRLRFYQNPRILPEKPSEKSCLCLSLCQEHNFWIRRSNISFFEVTMVLRLFKIVYHNNHNPICL